MVNFKFSSPWWSEQCEEAILERNAALSSVRKNLCEDNVISYRRAVAKARHVIEAAKALSKKNFISSINSQSRPDQIWNKVNSFRKVSEKRIVPIIHNGAIITSDLGRAEIFANFFGGGNSLDSPVAEEDSTTSGGNINESVQEANNLITLEEIKETISNLKNGSPGIDTIHNSFIKKLPEEYLPKLLLAFNKIYNMSKIPMLWKTALVVPIPKGNKDKTNGESFRPIALLPCMGKVIEKIIKNRLYWIAEKLCLFSPDQSGFRRRLCITDQVARVENQIRVGLVSGAVVAAVFIDLKSAYDLVSHQKLLRLLKFRGIEGNLLGYLHSFLSERTARVGSGSALSEPYNQIIGLPQGSSLSPLLFNIFIADIPKWDDVLVTEYADDVAILVCSSTVDSATAKLQSCLTEMETFFSNKSLLISSD